MAVTPRNGTGRQGQFFVIGALLIASLITGFVLSDSGGIHAPTTQAPQQLFERAMDEFPSAINSITAEDAAPAHVRRRITSYLAFQDHVFTTHGVRADSHALTSIPRDGETTFLLANFRTHPLQDVTLSADGTTRTADTVPVGDVETFTIPSTTNLTVRLSFTADHPFNHRFTVSGQRQSALFHLRVQGQDQVWQDTRIY